LNASPEAGTQLGYIAEEVDEIDKYFAKHDTIGTPLTIDWNNIVLYLVEEMKKLKNIVMSNQDTIIQHENTIKTQETIIKSHENTIEEHKIIISENETIISSNNEIINKLLENI
jgi:hypothetical protein